MSDSSLFFSLINWFADNHITYHQAKQVLYLATRHIQESRENLEYDTFADYLTGSKNRDAGNVVVARLS